MLHCRADDDEIKGVSLWSVGRVKNLLSSIGKPQARAYPAQSDDGMPTLQWFTVEKHTSADELTEQLNEIARACKAGPAADDITLSGRIARMRDPQWFKRRIRRALRRENEAAEHAAGQIRRKHQCYVSDWAVKITNIRDKANRQILDGLEVVNEDGEAFNLGEVVDGSISNPKLRRGELMMRCRGFEEVAQFMGHQAVFLTITAPSRFHRINFDGHENKKWTGDTPREAQDYLCKTWEKIRAAWGRAKFRPYGFRVAEPHHDGCPHWHILLFMAADQVGWFEPDRFVAGQKDHGAGVVGIAGKYALKDSPAERGANKHRYKVELIDGSKGSATGYIAKYIAKNIDGLTEAGDSVGMDYASGKKASDGAVRVRTWAATWGIRQFQQLGGPSVTVWRELRRMREQIEQPVQAAFDWEAIRAATDGDEDEGKKPSWALFWMLQGGPEVKRSELACRPFYVADTLGKYGDEVQRVYGVLGRDEQGQEFALQTRRHVWAVQRAGQADTEAYAAEWTDYMDVKKATAKFFADAGITREVFDAGRAASGAWTGVNNCTESGENQQPHTFNFDGFEPGGGEIPYLPEYSRAGDPADVAAEVAILEELWNMQQLVDGYGNWQAPSGPAHTATTPPVPQPTRLI